MITCQHARHLFDSYLDGELSANLQTELHAHRLNCTACQNELALLEACGDVIAMDRREPQIGVSFSDRVLLARRGRQMPTRRRWGRACWLVGSPMAAAASLAFTLFVIAPQDRATPKTEVAGAFEVAPEAARKVMLAETGRKQTPAEEQSWKQGNEMPAEIYDLTLAKFLNQSKSAVEGTCETAVGLKSLMGAVLSNTNDMVVAQLRSAQQEKAAATAVQERLNPDMDPLDPSYLSQPPTTPDVAGESDWTGPIEAL